MSIRNLHFYNANEQRDYPLSDQATSLTQSGNRLPPDVLVDLNLRFPNTLGTYPFVASVSVTATLVSVTLQAANTLDDATTFQPLAVISIPLTTLIEGRAYALAPQQAGVGGWIVFGSGVRRDTPFSGRFTVAGGLLATRAARPYRPLPVGSLAKLHSADKLTGIVRLRGEEPIEVVGEEREINGVLRTVGVVRLVQPEGAGAVNSENVFEKFSGPCAKRPESKNCGDFEPIEQINGVLPNCNGNITIRFAGCAVIAALQSTCGIVVDCGLGMKDACVGGRVPNDDGMLPTDFVDTCVSIVSMSMPDDDDGIGPPPPDTDNDSDVSETITGTLPTLFTFNNQTATHWQEVSGQWGYTEDDTTTECPIAQAVYTAGGDIFGEATDDCILGTPPDAPSSLTATAVSTTQINLTWSDDSSDETGFEIQRKTGSGGTYVTIHTTAANVESYNNTGLTASTEYYYRVRAINLAGASAYATEDSATTDTPSTTPVFHLTFEEGSGTTLTSIVGGHTATTSGGPTFTAGRIGTYAMTFDGTDDRVDADSFEGVTGTGPGSIALWIKTTQSSSANIVSWGDRSTTNHSVSLALNAYLSDGSSVSIDTANASINWDNADIHDGTWHHLALTWPANSGTSNFVLYVDGVDQGGPTSGANFGFSTLDIATGSNPVRLGTQLAPYNDAKFNGSLDDVRIYDVQLSAIEVAALAGM